MASYPSMSYEEWGDVLSNLELEYKRHSENCPTCNLEADDPEYFTCTEVIEHGAALSEAWAEFRAEYPRV